METKRMFKHWDQVQHELLTTIDLFHNDELSFTPFDGSWPVGQIMLHIADCEANWLHGVVKQEFEPWVTFHLEDYPTKEQVKQKLIQVHDKTSRLFGNLEEHDLEEVYPVGGETFTLGWILWHVLEHEIHHRGELSLALGLLGRAGLDV